MHEGRKEGRKEGNLYLAKYTYIGGIYNTIISAWETTLRPLCGRYRDGHHNTKTQTRHNYIN